MPESIWLQPTVDIFSDFSPGVHFLVIEIEVVIRRYYTSITRYTVSVLKGNFLGFLRQLNMDRSNKKILLNSYIKVPI